MRDIFSFSRNEPPAGYYARLNDQKLESLASRLRVLEGNRTFFELTDSRAIFGRQLTVNFPENSVYVIKPTANGMFVMEERFHDAERNDSTTGEMRFQDAVVLFAAKVMRHFPVASRAGVLEFLINPEQKKDVRIAGKIYRALTPNN